MNSPDLVGRHAGLWISGLIVLVGSELVRGGPVEGPLDLRLALIGLLLLAWNVDYLRLARRTERAETRRHELEAELARARGGASAESPD